MVDPIYKFSKIETDIDMTKNMRDIFSRNEKDSENISTESVMTNGVFDNNLFNQKLDFLSEQIYQKNKLNENLKLFELKNKLPHYDDMTIKQLMYGLYYDFYDMFIEFWNIKSISDINLIINKNYRMISILLIIFLLLCMIYIII